LECFRIIYLREGLYNKANNCFEKFLKLTEGTRYKRETFQLYRNLALSEYNLARTESIRKRELLYSSIENSNNALRCRNIDPTSPEFTSKDLAVFIARFNRSQTLVEREEEEDIKFAIKELKNLNKSIPELLSTQRSQKHWKGNIITQLIKSYSFLSEKEKVKLLMNELKEIYFSFENSEIEKQRFGIQNATENLQSILTIALEKKILEVNDELYNQLSELHQRISNLTQKIPKISLRDWSKYIYEIEKIFLT